MSFARAFTALTGASAVSMLAQLLRGKLAALFLGPAGVGIFNQLSLAWNIVQTVGGLGSFNGLIQHGAEALGKDDQVALRRLTSTFTLLLGVVSLAIALTGAMFAAPLSNWLLHDSGKHAPLLALLMLAAPIGVSAQLWRALLSAGQQVSSLVRAQIAADLGGAMVFAVLVVRLGLTGAVIGFLASQLILFLVQGWYIRKKLGSGLLRPRLSLFNWAVVRSNLGFGASGLVLIVLVNLGVLLVSQLLIGRLGPEANGYFANAWRIASVYLGAVTATTIGYFVPSLTRSPDNAAMGREVNATLRFYLVVLPPVMATIMALGEWVVWLILSSKFAPVAPLLLLFVPAELARIAVDTLLAQHMARRRLGPLTFTYLLQFAAFVGLAWLLVPFYGVVGAAVAYALAMGGSLLLALALSMAQFDFRLESATLRLSVYAAFLLAAVGVACAHYSIALTRLGFCALAAAVWLALTLREDWLRRLLSAGLVQLKRHP
jgi:O-antigen/teichoic acid export membrane protein